MPVLNKEEIINITKKKQRSAQRRVLRFMGIEHRTRPDGSILISRTHFEKMLDGDSENNRIERRIEPDWSVFDAKASSK